MKLIRLRRSSHACLPKAHDQTGLVKTAQMRGLNEKSFQTCLTSGKFTAQVEQDVQDGTKADVNGTPGFFINGEFVNGTQTEGEFEKIIERELALSRDRTSIRAAVR
jgi:predicted DsbA family dithiol-disulfide isomerase